MNHHPAVFVSSADERPDRRLKRFRAKRALVRVKKTHQKNKLVFCIQPFHDVIELIEIAVADMHGTAGIAVIDADP